MRQRFGASQQSKNDCSRVPIHILDNHKGHCISLILAVTVCWYLHKDLFLYVTTMMDASSMLIVNYSGPGNKDREAVKKSGGKIASPLPAKGKYK